jgi:hypothetical protein
MGLITTGFLFLFLFFSASNQELPPHRSHLFVRSVKMIMEKKKIFEYVSNTTDIKKEREKKRKKKGNHDNSLGIAF